MVQANYSTKTLFTTQSNAIKSNQDNFLKHVSFPEEEPLHQQKLER